MKIILASNNKNKLREIKDVLSPYGYEVISQAEAGADIEAEETGSTFEENAEIKARAVYDICHTPVIADDSGLTVDALFGAPGIYSARYAEPGKRCLRILDEMKDIPEEKRSAKFVCVICYIGEDGSSRFFRGECSGRIGYEKRGENGFGYDPIFLYDTRTFAELTSEEKNRVSHRANALAKFEEFIKGNTD